MVVEAIPVRLVFPSNVHHGVAGPKEGRVAGPDQLGVGIDWDVLPEHVDSQGLIGVEVAIVGADGQSSALGFEPFRCILRHLEDCRVRASEHADATTGFGRCPGQE